MFGSETKTEIGFNDSVTRTVKPHDKAESIFHMSFKAYTLCLLV